MELTEDLPEVLVGLGCDDETHSKISFCDRIPPLSSAGLVVTVADGAQRIDTIALLLVTSHPWEVKLWVSIQSWMGGIYNSNTTGTEVAGG